MTFLPPKIKHDSGRKNAGRRSLCRDCHRRQHQIGEGPFEREYGISLKVIAEEFFRRSPHRSRLA